MAAAESACDRGPKFGAPDHVSKVGDAQQAAAGSVVATAPAIVVLDEGDRGVPGIEVTFTVTTGGGTIEHATAITDRSGTATAGAWTLGTLTGAQSLRASADSVPGLPATFIATANAGPVVALTKVGVEPASSPAGSNVDSIVVRATDQFGNAVPNEAIRFEVTAGGGTVSPATRTTLADGRAAARWTIGPAVDAQNAAVASRTNGSLPVTFTTLGTHPIAAVRFGAHVLVVDSAQTITPAVTIVDATGAVVPGATALLASRNVDIASAGASAVFGVKAGQTFLVASSFENASIRDSAVVVVASAAKPAVTLGLPRFDLKSDTTFTVSLVVDSRSTSVGIGAATLQVVWNPQVLTYVGNQAGSSTDFVDVNASQAAGGVLTVAMASTAGFTGASELRRLTFKSSAIVGRAGTITVEVAEMVAAGSFANLAGETVSGAYPVRIR